MIFDVNSFCLFIGYARSGSSAIGAIVDAHPNAIISHEINFISMIKKGNIKNQQDVIDIVYKNSSELDSKGRWSGGATGEVYNQSIDGQIKSDSSIIKIIGDKKSGGVSRSLSTSLEKTVQQQEEKIKRLIGGLQDICHVPCKFIHVLRNPYDIVAAQIQSNIRFNTKRFIKDVETVSICKRLFNDNWLDLYHEEILDNPRDSIIKVNDFLGLAQFEKHLDASVEHLKFKPKPRRFEIEWSKKTKNKIKNKVINSFEFFKNYDF
jgi:hypothetical protein